MADTIPLAAEGQAPHRFEIKLHPYLKMALRYRAEQRGLDLSGYIQELLWKHCPEAADQLEAAIGQRR